MSSPSKTSTGAKAKLVKLGMVNFSKYKKTQLINHFQALYNALKDRMTSGALKEIPPATIELLSHRNILNHKEKGVRILVAQIWCEIFRIVAPEKVPMTSKTLKSIFSVIIQQISGLVDQEDQAQFEQRASILRVVADESISVLLIDDMMDVGEDETVVELFDALIGSLHPAHSHQILGWMGEIFCTCLSEMEDGGIPESVLDVLLRPLIKELRGDGELMLIDGEVAKVGNAPPTYRLIQMVIAHCADFLGPVIADFVNATLVGVKSGGDGLGTASSSAGAGSSASEIREYIHPLVYELHVLGKRKGLNLIASIMPNLSKQLQTEDDSIRLQTVALLGKLFCESTTMHTEHSSVLSEWLGRFLDKSSSIRKEMIVGSCLLLRAQPSLSATILPKVVDKLLDPDVDVRFQAVDKLCTVAFFDLMVLPKTAFRRLKNRMDDRRVEIATAAMIGLSRIFNQYISKLWPSDWDPTLGSSFFTQFSNEVTDRILEIPGHLATCFTRTITGNAGQGHLAQTQQVVMKMFDEQILPKKASSRVRAEILLACYRSFSRDQRESFLYGMRGRSQAQKTLIKMVALRDQLKAMKKRAKAEKAKDAMSVAAEKASAAVQTIEKSLDSIFSALVAQLPPPSGGQPEGLKHFHALLSFKDETVFKSLVKCCDNKPVGSFGDWKKEFKAARDYILGRFGTDSAASAYFLPLFRMIYITTIFPSADSIGHIAEIGKICHDDRDEIKALDCLHFIGEICVGTLMGSDGAAGSTATSHTWCHFIQPCLPFMTPLIRSENVDVAQSVLRTLARVVPRLATTAPSSMLLSKSFTSAVLKTLVHVSFNGVALHAKYATKILSIIYTLGDDGREDSADGPAVSTSVQFWKRFTSDAIAEDNLSTKNEHLDALLMSLASAMEASPQVMGPFRDRIASFVRKYCTPRVGEGHSASVQPPLRPQAVVSACKWMCNSLVKSPVRSSSHQGHRTLFKEECQRTLNSLRRLARDNEDSSVRFAAGCAILKLARHNDIEACLDARTWQVLAHLVQDSDENMREMFSLRIHKACINKHLAKPTKYGALLVLRGLEDDVSVRSLTSKHIAEIMLAAKRQYFGYARAKIQASTLNILRNIYRPESFVVYATHLIAHYSVRKDDQSAGFPKTRRLILFLIKTFALANFYNYNYLLEMLRHVDQSNDILGKTKYTRLAAELFILMLKGKNKNSKVNDFGEDPNYLLPPQLFGPGRGGLTLEPVLPEDYLDKLKTIAKQAKTPSSSERGTKKKRKSVSPEGSGVKKVKTVRALSPRDDAENVLNGSGSGRGSISTGSGRS
jgi:hypothetical protein